MIFRRVSDEKDARGYLQALAGKMTEEMDHLKSATTRTNTMDKWQTQRRQKVDRQAILELQSNLQSEIQAKQNISEQLNKATERTLVLERYVIPSEVLTPELQEHPLTFYSHASYGYQWVFSTDIGWCNFFLSLEKSFFFSRKDNAMRFLCMAAVHCCPRPGVYRRICWSRDKSLIMKDRRGLWFQSDVNIGMFLAQLVPHKELTCLQTALAVPVQLFPAMSVASARSCFCFRRLEEMTKQMADLSSENLSLKDQIEDLNKQGECFHVPVPSSTGLAFLKNSDEFKKRVTLSSLWKPHLPNVRALFFVDPGLKHSCQYEFL